MKCIFFKICILITLPIVHGTLEFSEECEEDGPSTGSNKPPPPPSSSKCRCGIENDGKPGVRPWTVFVHIPRSPAPHVGTIISSNIIVVAHKTIFDPIGKFDATTPGISPYLEGAKLLDIDKIKVTETPSNDSKSYKIVGTDILQTFLEHHPEDKSPPVNIAAIIVDHNFASGEGPKWPICLPKTEHIGTVNEISLIPPDGVTTDEYFKLLESQACVEPLAKKKFVVWNPPEWEAMCTSPVNSPWAAVGGSPTIASYYKIGNTHFMYGISTFHTLNTKPFFQFAANLKFGKKRLEEIVGKRPTELCSE